MPKPRRRPKPDRRRALELLAASPDGYTEALMLAHGFSTDMMAELVNAGLATATSERVVRHWHSGCCRSGGPGRFVRGVMLVGLMACRRAKLQISGV
jgi:hypothetical protein